ncbi:MAG TPA: phospholipase D-like domain-containing protein [Smithellaceae bacterium]|nr:phospholipase D-like domain-containing protein [Smithellaceae bacterium]
MKNICSAPKTIVSVFLAALLLFIILSSADAREKSAGTGSDVSCPVIALKNKDFFPALLKAIDEAREEIFISMFSFRAGVHKRSYPDRVLAHLGRAVQRGVKVKVILEDTGKKSDELTLQNRQTKKLLEDQGIFVYGDSPKKTTHTKLIVIDQRLVILGSHNLTQSALKYNNEISLLVENHKLARDIREYMLAIIKEAK